MTRSAWGPRWKYNQHGFYNSARGEIFCLTLGFFFPLACFCWTRRVVRYFPNPQASCNDGGGKKKEKSWCRCARGKIHRRAVEWCGSLDSPLPSWCTWCVVFSVPTVSRTSTCGRPTFGRVCRCQLFLVETISSLLVLCVQIEQFAHSLPL